MRIKSTTSSLLSFALLLVTSICLQANLSQQEADTLATDAYIYAYPLITMDMTRQVMTNVPVVDGLRAPMGQFVNARSYPDASFHDVTAPNADTLYSTAWIDLSKEPYVLHIPDLDGRYYLMPMLDGWTEVFAVPGTRTTGTKEGNFAITGPGWKGTLPQGLTEYKSATNLVWILGRTYCTGTPEDLKAVHEIQDKYSISPLSAWGKSYTPPKGIVNPNLDMKTSVRDQVNKLDGKIFFKRFADLLKNNPPTPEDSEMVAKLAKMGIIPGKDFEINSLDASLINAIQKAPKLGLEKILNYEKTSSKKINGWAFSLNTGIYGTNYLQRALVTMVGLGANRPQDAIYPYALTDSNGNPLSGAGKYTIHFKKEETPPVEGFWSLTMYNDKLFFAENPLNRYTLSPRNPLKYNEDGSLDLYIQHESPGDAHESNWLPAPEGKFVLMLRLYWPKEAILNGSWTPPPITRQLPRQE